MHGPKENWHLHNIPLHIGTRFPCCLRDQAGDPSVSRVSHLTLFCWQPSHSSMLPTPSEAEVIWQSGMKTHELWLGLISQEDFPVGLQENDNTVSTEPLNKFQR